MQYIFDITIKCFTFERIMCSNIKFLFKNNQNNTIYHFFNMILSAIISKKMYFCISIKNKTDKYFFIYIYDETYHCSYRQKNT